MKHATSKCIWLKCLYHGWLFFLNIHVHSKMCQWFNKLYTDLKHLANVEHKCLTNVLHIFEPTHMFEPNVSDKFDKRYMYLASI